jgi:uncharacterized protein YbbC (DUF1343 family)
LLEEQTELIKGKHIGLITNHTGVDSKLRSTIDLLYTYPDAQLVALFAPEHGIRGDKFAGEPVTDEVDTKTGVKVYSLYGNVKKPTKEMLKDIDVLIYDIQDIGCRSYTYIYTMAACMEAAKENNIKFIVLDRPNPLGGELVDGNVLDPKFASGIGRYPIAYVYGMTVGELAMFFNTEFNINCDLTVVKMKGWNRKMKFFDTGLPWVHTSPHIPQNNTPFYYPLTGIIGELDSVNIGVGYTLPFELIGAPWIDHYKLAEELNLKKINGVYFYPIVYQPKYHNYANQKCYGVLIYITDYSVVRPVEVGIHIIEALIKLFPENNIFTIAKRTSGFDKAMGTDKVRTSLSSGVKAKEVINSWKEEINEFLKKREKHLLY